MRWIKRKGSILICSVLDNNAVQCSGLQQFLKASSTSSVKINFLYDFLVFQQTYLVLADFQGQEHLIKKKNPDVHGT